MSDWRIITSEAEKQLSQQNIWTSFVEQRQYRVSSVDETRIEIERLSGGQNSILTPGMALNAIAKLRQHDVQRGELMNNVAKECALIQFHPNIFWDRASDHIVWRRIITAAGESIAELVAEASDDEFERVLVAVNQRKFQSVFRSNLLTVYKGRCVVSDNSNIAVLEAAHIIRHAVSANNDTMNGLLLRADLHILFDRNLLLIHPSALTVHLSPSIQDADYTRFEGKKIRDRADKKTLRKEYLIERWNAADWTTEKIPTT